MISDEGEAKAFVADWCDNAGMERLEKLVSALCKENERQNLVAKNSLQSVWQRHIADSVQLLDFAEDADGPWLDLGSGAGFPGLAIAACRPEMAVILVESRRKRIDWLDRMVGELALENCQVVGSRLEQVETFDAGVISARAFAPLPRLIDLSSRFSTSRTVWVLPKGRSAAQEVAELPKRGRAMFHVEQSKTDPEAGIIVGTGSSWRTKA